MRLLAAWDMENEVGHPVDGGGYQPLHKTFKWDWDANPVTKPSTYSLSCLHMHRDKNGAEIVGMSNQ